MNGTAAALIARGLDISMATTLAQQGVTIARLKQMTEAEVKNLGLNESQVSNVQKGSRPPIPEATTSRLLFDNRYQCCVCRDPSRPFIIHHIDDWAKSRSHDISNLVVLCLHHHAEAHSKSTLNQNLDAKALRAFKTQWEQEVKRLDARSVIDALSGEYAHWAFINELRLLELAREHQVSLIKLSFFRRAKLDGVVDATGSPLPVPTNTFYKYEGINILTRYAYMKELLEEVIERIPIINISDYLDRSIVLPSIFPGDFIITEGAHTFSALTDVKKGIGQACRGKRSANNVEISFVFDRWEAASSSSKHDWLVATKTAASLLQVRDIRREDGTIKITGTALAIASFVSSLKTREYADSWIRWRPRKPTKRPTFML